MSLTTLRKMADGTWVQDKGGMAWSIALHKDDIYALTQKNATLDWLRQQVDGLTISPNSTAQCVYGQMLRDIFGNDHDFCVCFDNVTWEEEDRSYIARVTPFAALYQQELIDYIDERDGEDSNGTVTRAEAIKVAKATLAR